MLRSVYLRAGRVIGAPRAGDIRAAGTYRSVMTRRVDVSGFGRHLVEPRFAEGDVAAAALP